MLNIQRQNYPTLTHQLHLYCFTLSLSLPLASAYLSWPVSGNTYSQFPPTSQNLKVKRILWSFWPLVALWSNVCTNGPLFGLYHMHAHEWARINVIQNHADRLTLFHLLKNGSSNVSRNVVLFLQMQCKMYTTGVCWTILKTMKLSYPLNKEVIGFFLHLIALPLITQYTYLFRNLKTTQTTFSKCLWMCMCAWRVKIIQTSPEKISNWSFNLQGESKLVPFKPNNTPSILFLRAPGKSCMYILVLYWKCQHVFNIYPELTL